MVATEGEEPKKAEEAPIPETLVLATPPPARLPSDLGPKADEGLIVAVPRKPSKRRSSPEKDSWQKSQAQASAPVPTSFVVRLDCHHTASAL